MKQREILRWFCREIGNFSKKTKLTREKEFVMEEQMMSFSEQRFSDKAYVTLRAGNGGNGCISYFRSRIVVSGAPDGGDGSEGSSIYFKAIETRSDLRHMKMASIKGHDGENGRMNNRNGKRGGDVYVNVPVGTLVWEIVDPKDPETENLEVKEQNEKGIPRDEEQEGPLKTENVTNVKAENKPLVKPKPARKWKDKLKNKRLLADLDEPGMICLAAKGGKGGRGNQGIMSKREVEYGQPGEKKDILLELKILADFGLVGFPNAGKSTLLATLTRTLPKIADYPFTTLSPLIGRLKFIDEKYVTIADLPGIIEGSAQNKGLGHEFLRHIERTKGLVYVFDLSLSADEIFNQYTTLKNEINAYSEKITKKPHLIVLNKSDMALEKEKKIKRVEELMKREVFTISAKFGENLSHLVRSLRDIVHGK